MNLGKITLITPPDNLFNACFSYLLVKPSVLIKQQFQTILSSSNEDLNVFIFDDDEFDIQWLLSVALQAEVVIIDVDNCDPITGAFITFLLAQPNVFFITSDEVTPYGLISKNRIYDLDSIIQQLKAAEEGDDSDVEED